MKKTKYKISRKYKQLYKSNFKEIDNRIAIHVGDDVFCISKFLTITEINGILEEFYDFFGYDIFSVAETDDDNYICLYYKENIKKSSIIYWNYELALENQEEGILFLYDSIYEFETKMIKK